MCSGILPEMFAKTAPTSSLLPVPSCQQRRRRRCPHSPTLADSRPALLCLLRRPSARYPHEKNVTVHPRHSQYNRMHASRAFYCHEPRFGVACFSFFISLADSRSALPCLLRRPSARYPHEKNVTVHPRHSQNRVFGVACFSFVLDTLYPRWLLTSTKLLVQYRKFC